MNATERCLTFEVTVKNIETIKIPLSKLQDIIDDDNLFIDINNITPDDVREIYNWIDASAYTYGTEFIDAELNTTNYTVDKVEEDEVDMSSSEHVIEAIFEPFELVKEEEPTRESRIQSLLAELKELGETSVQAYDGYGASPMEYFCRQRDSEMKDEILRHIEHIDDLQSLYVRRTAVFAVHGASEGIYLHTECFVSANYKSFPILVCLGKTCDSSKQAMKEIYDLAGHIACKVGY